MELYNGKVGRQDYSFLRMVFIKRLGMIRLPDTAFFTFWAICPGRRF